MQPLEKETWEHLIALVRGAEGFREFAYWDISQYSGGYGHKLPKEWDMNNRISLEQANEWLDKDLSDSLIECQKRFIAFWEILNDVRKATLVEMCFNIGMPRMLGFRKMIAALRRGDYAEAGYQMLWNAPNVKTRWHEQIGQRASRLACQMIDGEFG